MNIFLETEFQHTLMPNVLDQQFLFGTEGIMVFTNQTSHDLYYQQGTNNSLYTMERESRYVWKHEMLNLGSKGKRYVAENPISDGNSRFSITFRIV